MMRSPMSALLSVTMAVLLVLACKALYVHAAEEEPSAAPIQSAVGPGRDLARYYFDLGRVHANYGFYEQSLEAFVEAEKQLGVTNLGTLLPTMKADVLAKLDRTDEAVQAYRDAQVKATTEEEKRSLEMRVARLQSKAGKPGEASRTYEGIATAAKEPWLRQRTFRKMVDAEKKAGTLDASLARYEEAADKNPEDAQVLGFLLEVYSHHQVNLVEAIDVAKHLLAIEPDDPYLTNELAELLARAGKPDEAVVLYEKLAESQPQEKGQYLSRIVSAYLDAGNPDKAVGWAVQMRTTEGDTTAAWSRYGLVCMRAKHVDEGVAAFKKAAEFAPKGRDQDLANLRLADALVSAGKKDEARVVLDDIAKNASMPEVKAIAVTKMEVLGE